MMASPISLIAASKKFGQERARISNQETYQNNKPQSFSPPKSDPSKFSIPNDRYKIRHNLPQNASKPPKPSPKMSFPSTQSHSKGIYNPQAYNTLDSTSMQQRVIEVARISPK